MSTLKLGAARVIHEGIRDLSGRVVVQPTAVEPTHVPIIFLLTAKQREEPIFMYPSQIEQLLGSETVERGSKYYSHQTQLLEIIAQNANPFLCYPVKVEGSKKAFIRLSVAVTAETKQQTPDGSETPFYRLTWMSGVSAYPEELQGYGEAASFTINDGLQPIETTIKETIVYPILEMELEYPGDYGNSYGIQIKQITSKTSPQGITKNPAMAYTLSVVERTKSGSIRIVKTVFGEDTIPFTLDADVTDRFGRPLHLPLAFESNYNITVGSNVENFGEFGGIDIYQQHLETVQGLLFESERHFDDLIPESLAGKWRLGDDAAKASLLNIFSGKMADGETSYQSFVVDKALLIGTGNYIFATGGDSGIPLDKTARARFNRANGLLDSFVFDLQNEVSSEFSNLHNHDRWDFSIAYDTGFAPEAKDTLISLLSARKDVSLFLTPMSYGQLEVVPDIEVVSHDGYMRSVNNFTPIPHSRTGTVELKGLITNLIADREISQFTVFVDDVPVESSDFRIDDKGYWTASIDASSFGGDAYSGLVHFTVVVSVKDHPDYPSQLVTSTKMAYQITSARLPVVTITRVWGGNPVPYTKDAGEYTGTTGAIVATVSSADGEFTDLYEVISAKFTYGAAKELDITRNFVVWNEVYATPTRKDMLNNYAKKVTAKLVMRIRDRLSLEVKTVESPAFEYDIGFPNLNPILTVTEINGGQPVIPNYTDVTAPTVKVKGTVTGLGVDGLLSLDRVLVKVAGVTVSGANVQYTPATDGASATFEATVQRGYFPVLASNDQNISISSPAAGVIGESYHALADVEVHANYKQLHLANAILPLEHEREVYVSDVISMTSDWDGVVDYNDPISDLIDPNDGIKIVSNIPTTTGIENVGFSLNGSFYDYQEIVTAKATLAGNVYDLKVLSNYTVGAARVIAERFWPSYAKTGSIALELVVKHRSGHNVKMNVNQPYTVRYPTLPAVTTKVTSINGTDKIWFDENWGNANKTVPVTGEITGLHTLRSQKNIQLAVDNIIREDVVVVVNKALGTWTADLPVKYMNLSTGGQAQLNLVLTYLPDRTDIIAQASARSYTVQKVVQPSFAVDSVNGGTAITWANGQDAEHRTDVIIGGYVQGVATAIDPTVFTMNSGVLTINDTIVPSAQVNWSRRVVGGVEKVVASVPTAYLIFQDRPFASSGALTAKITLSTNHNNRPYEILTAVTPYAITPQMGVVAVSVESYNNGAEIDALNTPNAVYTLRGEVTGMTPFQSVKGMKFKFQDLEVTPTTYQLGVAVTDAGGFVTYPFTATFVGGAHLQGVTLANLAGYTDSLSTDNTTTTPTTKQGAYDLTSSVGTGWSEMNTGTVNPNAYKGSIKATATIGNSVTAIDSSVGSYNSLTYSVTPLRAMVTKMGSYTSTFLDPMTEVVANQVRKLLNFEFGMVRTDYEEITGIEVKVGTKVVTASDVRYHRRDVSSAQGEGKYQRHLVDLSIPNKYIVDYGEYLEMAIPAYQNGESAVGLYKVGVTVTVTARNKANNTTRAYAATGTLFSRAYYAVRATAEILSINNGNAINRWGDKEALIPIQIRVNDLYKRAMGHTPTEFNFTVDGRVLNGVTVSNITYTAAQYYNSLSVMTATGNVKMGDLIELMTIWADNGRVAPFKGTLTLTPKVVADNTIVTTLTAATRQFTATEVLPASTSTMDLEPVDGGATVILNSLSTYPVEVTAVVHALHPIWSEVINPELVTFGINGQTVPRADYQITVTTGAVDAQGQQDAVISIKADRSVYNRYFNDAYLNIDEVSLEAGVPVTGTVRVSAPVSSTYGLRATLTQTEDFLAGKAVEGPEDDVTVASLDSQQTVITDTDGFRIVDLTTGEVLAEGDDARALRDDANLRGSVQVDLMGMGEK